MANSGGGIESVKETGDTNLSGDDEFVLANLFENWEQFSEAGSVLAPISPLAMNLLNLDRDSSTPGRDLTGIVESDPVLTARVLGLANSVFFAASTKPIFKISEAVTRLGVDTILTAAFSQMTAQWLRGTFKRSDRALIHGLWLEYLITAHCSREIARRLPSGEVDIALAYAAGLLHDLGTIALLCVQPEPMSRFVRSGYGVGTPLHASFVTAHTRLGEGLLKSWRAPADIATVAGRHHSRSMLSQPAVSVIVVLADHLHMAVLDHDSAEFVNPEGCRPGCFGAATEFVSAGLAALGIADDLDSMVGRVAAESRSIEMLGTVVHL
ncbi:MAG TPA: HDOD domain-containing protein [Burkholderiales bacterium]|nr:HDOD domain-containing protein [Burkholderiales bacterium]